MSSAQSTGAHLEHETWELCPYDAVVLAFLRAEWRRWHLNERGNPRLILQPDLTDPAQNVLRRALLHGIRGPLLQHVPSDTTWYAVRHLGTCHFWNLRNINHRDWIPHSHANELLETARIRPEAMRPGAVPAEWQPILWGHERIGPFTILEGNHRMTALAGAQDRFQTLRMIAYVGLSAELCGWHRADRK